MKLRIVEDWRQGWKWASAQLSVVSGATHGVLASIAGGMKLALPLVGIVPLRWVFIAGAVLSVGTFVGRFLKREPKTDG